MSCPKVSLNSTARITNGSSEFHCFPPRGGHCRLSHLFCSVSLRTPPGRLPVRAAADGPVDDWSFANEVPLCQLQIYAGIRPHSINLNCMSTPAGELYLSCSVCEQKYWAARVDANESAVMRLDGVTYPVVLNRVRSPPDGCRLECEDHQTAKLWRRTLQSDTGPGRAAP